MRLTFLILCFAITAACSSPAQSEPLPAPPREAIPMLTAETGSDWRQVAPENLLVVDTVHGRILIELNPDFAPGHTARMRQLARDRVLDRTEFYRAITGFVAQTGLNQSEAAKDYPAIVNENERPISEEAGFTPLGNDDLYAPEVGHTHGFATARNAETGKEWLLHCPGAVAMARDNDPDSGTADYYIVLDAQRYLDRNLTVFGRVLSGMEVVQKVKRGTDAMGFIEAPLKGDRIQTVKLASEMPEDQRPVVDVMKTDSGSFEGAKRAKRVRRDPFFYNKPPEVIDICDMPVPTKVQEPN